MAEHPMKEHPMKFCTPSIMRALTLLTTGCLVAGLAACPGRDPSIAKKNDDAISEGEGEGGEGEGEPVRTLGVLPLFGTLPVDNRFMDPLFTTGSNAWFSFGEDFQAASFYLNDEETPTRTRAIELAGPRDQPTGVYMLTLYKSAAGPQTVSVWLGRAGAETDFSDVEIAVSGMFSDGSESGVNLEPDDATVRVIGQISWVQFSATLEDGPIGWASLQVFNEGQPLRLAGPLAVDGTAAGAGSLVRFGQRRPLTDAQRRMSAALADKMREQLMKPRTSAMGAGNGQRTR
jgi:hypothetical protein